MKCEQTEKRAAEQRQVEEKKHTEEIQFLKRTTQQLKVNWGGSCGLWCLMPLSLIFQLYHGIQKVKWLPSSRIKLVWCLKHML